MFDALRSTRAISKYVRRFLHYALFLLHPTHPSARARSKSVSYAVWYPNLARAHVTVARGVHFTSMGHSVQRPSSSSLPAGGPRKRLELLPEEALYLMEKGALFCWKASRDDEHDDAPGEDENEDKDVEWDSASQGAPMSVQQAYAEMIGREDLTLDRYQVCQSSLPLSCLTPCSNGKKNII
jgi:tRNA-splicing endonuclease subunit sen54 N-term